jgi:hypothetical protein
MKEKKARLRKLLVAKQFITEESRNKVAENKSWFTVCSMFDFYFEWNCKVSEMKLHITKNEDILEKMLPIFLGSGCMEYSYFQLLSCMRQMQIEENVFCNLFQQKPFLCFS